MNKTIDTSVTRLGHGAMWPQGSGSSGRTKNNKKSILAVVVVVVVVVVVLFIVVLVVDEGGGIPVCAHCKKCQDSH